MAASKESALTTKLKKYIEEKGGTVNKNHGGPNSQGRPDLEGGYRGFHFGLEVKLPGKEKNVTKLQAAQLLKMKAAGSYAGVVTCKKDVDKMIKNLTSKAEELEWAHEH